MDEINAEIERQKARLADAYRQRDAAQKAVDEADNIIQALEWARRQREGVE